MVKKYPSFLMALKLWHTMPNSVQNVQVCDATVAS